MSQSTDPRPDTWHAPGAASMADPHEYDQSAGTSAPVGQPQSAGQPVPAGQYPPGQPARPAFLPPDPTPYGAPSTGGPFATPAHPGPAYGPAAPPPGPAWFNQTQPLPPVTQPGGAPGVPGHPHGPDAHFGVPQPRRESRRPGWSGVVAVGAGSAVLASLLTAGAITTFGDGTGSSGNLRPATAASAQSAPPLVTSTGSLPDWVAVASAVEPSVVSVQVETQGGGGEGSGVILDTSGRVLTNNHVVSGGGSGSAMSVVLSDGRAFPATIVGTDPSTDLAVIKINASVSGLKPATLGDSSKVKPGDPVMAAGNPLGLADTVTTGIVSAVNRPVSTQGQGGQGGQGQGGAARDEAVVTNAIQTDAAINPGNSGGALVDAGGRVIGITSSIASLSSGAGQSGSIGLGFAIPVNEAKQVADQLIKTGKVEHALIGVSLQNNSVSVDGAQREAAIVGSVNSGSPAAAAGLRARDAVIAINGQRIDSADSLVGSIRALTPGTKVTLTIVRDGKKLDVDVTLGTRAASGG
jgi:putative serine protease PepD